MLGAALHYFQEKLIFLPTTLDENYVYELHYPHEELFLTTEEGTSINAIHFKADKPKGVILYFHGNAGDLSRWSKITEYFAEKNYDVLVMDYRTYGKSKGKLSEIAMYRDAQYCYDYLLKQYSENDITLYGRSLGTGIASYLAKENKPKQLILETPYYSILDVAKHRFPIFPVKSLLRYHFPNFENLPQVDCPIHIFHGTDDKLVPFESGKKLSEVEIKDLNFVKIDGGRHNNLIEFEAYHNAIETILN
ncbi:alpha/beta hydrolase [Winogradskyella poriferorum]|uniref:alpha/beta hydrolase n=1 Tax=Winogradskyella poriferorum TaxID=307627 RepID=UPI003D65407C